MAKALDAKKTVVVLFWNKNGVDDRSVKKSVDRLSRRGGDVAKFTDTVKNLSRYTRITSAASVTTTPALVVVNRRGQAEVLTGYNDYQTINQFVWELVLLHTKPLGFRPAIPRSVRKRSHVRLVRRPDQRAAILGDASIFVPAPEGEQRLALEAAAAGVAIVEGNDPERVAADVARLATHADQRSRLAAEGRARAEQQSFDLVAKELDRLYSRLSRKRRAR